MKIWQILLWNSLWGFVYFGTNNICWFDPWKLPLFFWEKNISMNEWWMVFYMSWFLYNIIFCLAIKKGEKKFVALMTLLVFIHGIIFIFFPTEYEREYDIKSLCSLDRFFLSYDNPQNCLPSLHVSFVFLTLLMSSRLGVTGRKKYLFMIWGALIMVSTVLVKQHYVVDVLGAVAITTIFFLVFKIIFQKEL